MKVLLVTEKPSIARRISYILGSGKAKKEKGLSKYTPVYRFTIDTGDEFVVTSVLGHVYQLDFEEGYEDWNTIDPVSLFDAPTRYRVNDTNKEIPKVIKQLQKLGKDAEMLLIATDADSEGEKIGADISHIVSEANPFIIKNIRRMLFSAVTPHEITKSLNDADKTLINQKVVEKVESRQEIDLRSGSAFTRFQTIGVKEKGVDIKLVSFGPCQTACLSFVVERYLQRENFIPVPFWVINTQAEIDMQLYDLKWEKERMLNKQDCEQIFEKLKGTSEGNVAKIIVDDKNTYPPWPLNTVSFIRITTSQLGIPSDRAMVIAEKLYNAGIISYPRTETEIYPKTLSLKKLLEQHTEHSKWGSYVSTLLQDKIRPRRGKRDDKAHPPIHPTKSVELEDLLNMREFAKINKDDLWAVYNLISRHFFATLSPLATYREINATIKIHTENFALSGKQLQDKGFLEIYPFRRFAESPIPNIQEGDTVKIRNIEMKDNKTQPPALLSESELIRLMDEKGIGTDATIPSHIKTNKTRNYFQGVGKSLRPTPIGVALVKGLGSVDETLVKPKLRAYIETQTELVATGERNKQEVVKESAERMKKLFKEVVAQKEGFIDTLATTIQTEQERSTPKVDLFNCPSCGSPIKLHRGKRSYYLRCSDPEKKCKKFYPLPAGMPRAAKIICPLCQLPVINMTSPKGHEYNLCVSCWTEEIETDDGKKQRGPCFNCEIEECKAREIEKKTRPQCPSCNKGELVERRGKFGRFLGCTAYPECKFTINLYPGDKVTKTTCECGYPILSKISKEKKRYYKCARKDCQKEIDYDEARKHEIGVVRCPSCGNGELIERKGKYGRFLGCSNYPDCKLTISLFPGDNPLKTACPKCGFPLISKLSKKKHRYYKCPNKSCDYIEFPKTPTTKAQKAKT